MLLYVLVAFVTVTVVRPLGFPALVAVYQLHEVDRLLGPSDERVPQQLLRRGSLGKTIEKNPRYKDKEGRKEMFYLTTHSTHFIYGLYGVGHMVEDHLDSER